MSGVATNRTTVEASVATTILSRTHRVENIVVTNTTGASVDVILGDTGGTRQFHIAVPSNSTVPHRVRFIVDRGLDLIAPVPGSGVWITVFHGGEGG